MATECPAEDVVSLFLESRLPSDDASRIRAHLGRCEMCAELVGEVVRDARDGAVGAAFEEIGIFGRQRGELIGERFRLSHWIGAGQMGSVWEVEDLLGEHPLRAAKLIRDTGAERARLRREAKLLERLDHPNIVRAFGWYETEDGGALLLERLDGEALATRLARDGAIALTDAVGILRAVASALAHAHAAGVAHRDLKPSNVFLVNDAPHVRVVDLGLAAPTAAWNDGTLTSITAFGASVGTPLYMAPEQLFGQDIDERVDIWALGLLAHEMICGSLPFEAGPVGKLLRAIRRAPFAPLSKRRADLPVPAELDRAVTAWLAPDAEDRARSEEAARSLDEIAESLPSTRRW